MHALPVRNQRATGFTLIELLVTISIMALLATLAMPAFSTWIANSKVRTIANALQDGLRTAQTEATRRSRQVVFALTDDSNPSDGYTAKENGKYWAINTITLTDSGETAAFVEAGVLAGSLPSRDAKYTNTKPENSRMTTSDFAPIHRQKPAQRTFTHSS